MNDLMNDENNKKESIVGKMKSSFTGRNFRSGAYVSLISAIVIVLVLVVNLISSELDLRTDLSTQGLYTLTDDTVDLVKNMEDEVTIYYLIESGKEATIFKKIAEKYESLSDNITLVQKDPILYPKFAYQYIDESVTVNPNSFLVVNNSTNRAKYIDNSELLVKEFDYNAMDYYTTGIDMEGKITSAIQYVTNPDLPIMYVTTGHSEMEFGPLFLETLEKQNVTINSLSTLTENSIPEDCDILFINAPAVDFTEAELTMIKDYMAAGGNAIIVLDYLAESMKNLNSLLDYYGVQLIEGIVYEGDTGRHAANYPQVIVPEILNHDITERVLNSKRFIVNPMSSGLVQLDNIRSSLKTQPLLATSEQAYSKVNVQATTVSKEAEDIAGPFYLGLVATDTYDQVTSNLVVYTSRYFFEESTLEAYANEDILKSTVGYLAGDVKALSIRTRNILPQAINITGQQAYFWGAVTVVILPAIILIIGIFVTLRRRKR